MAEADGYTVTGQRETTVFVGNQWVKGMEVTFTTTAGVVGTVTTPLTAYNPDAVKTLIESRVAQIDAVSKL